MAVIKGIKIALPGYDAFNDTNPDHFALYVDQVTDHVLIKEKTVATASVNGTTNIAHGLGYVPFCLVFVETSSGVWRKVFSTPVDSSGYWFEINDTNLVLRNTTGVAKNFAYHIFYDNVGTGETSNNIITLNNPAIAAVAKIGKNALTSRDPNDFVFHSELNTFKIIAEGTKQVTLTASTNNQSFTQAHNQSFIPLIHAFAQRDGVNQVFLPNGEDVELWGPKLGWSGDVRFNYVSADATNITFNFDNAKVSSVVVNIRYFVLEKVD